MSIRADLSAVLRLRSAAIAVLAAATIPAAGAGGTLATTCGDLYDYKYNIQWEFDEHAHGQGGEFPIIIGEEGEWQIEGGPFLVSDPHYQFYMGHTEDDHHVPGIGCT